MKTLLVIIVCLSLSVISFGQVYNPKGYKEFSNIPENLVNLLGKMGIDKASILNDYESAYFNSFFQDTGLNFDFTEKKIGFMKSRRITDKKQYFEEERERFAKNSHTISASLIIFDENQKRKSGGYDAFILYWSKFSISPENIIKKIKKTVKRIK